MAYDDDITQDDLVNEDDLVTDPEDLEGTDDTDPTDEELLEEELANTADGMSAVDPLLADEAETLRNDRLSEPDTFGGPNDPMDNVDDANWEESEIRRGAGDVLDGEDEEESLGAFGFRVESFEDTPSDDDI